MLGSNTVRFQAVIGAVLCGALAAGTFACVSASAPSEADSAAPSQLLDVLVESSDQGSVVTVVGPESPVFTAFFQGDPDRVIVDLADVVAGELTEAIAVYDGLVDEVRVEGREDDADRSMTRLEIWLAAPADYDVRPGAQGLEIALRSMPDEAAQADGEGSDDWADASEPEDPWTRAPEGEGADAGMDEGMDASPGLAMGDASAPMEMRAATRLMGVEARSVGTGSVIHLQGDGSVESAVTFMLENPARLVIDLPDMRSEVASSQVEVGSDQVARVRVGAHADKVRVVMDGGTGEAPFDGRRVIPVPTGLVVALGADPALDAAVAEATELAPRRAMADEPMLDMADEPMLAMADPDAGMTPAAMDPAMADGAAMDAAMDPETGMGEPESMDPMAGSGAPEAMPMGRTVTIYGVEFDSQTERDRVVVLGDETVDYLVYEPDAETVILSISNAVISPDAAVRVAPELPGPVSLVTAFDQPDVETPEVRIVVKRAAHLKPDVSRKGSLLLMDFARKGGLAARPPVYAPGPPAGMDLDLAAGSPSAGDGSAPMGMGMEPTAPAALAPDMGMDADLGMAGLPMPGAPAAGTPPAAIEILNDGGLMDGKEYVGRRISLDFKEVDIADVLRLIAEVSDLNVIAGDEVKGKVTIRLVDVPWDQALDVILLTKGLGFARIGNVLRIAATDMLAQEEELRLQERRAKEKLEDLVVKLQPVNYADVNDVSTMVRELLTPRGSVNTDTRTNTLILKDIASVIDEATALVKAVDTMTPQVMIEAKIVEAGLEFSRELGSLWTFGTNPVTEATLGGRDYLFQGGDDDGIADGLGNQVVFGNPITAGPTGVLGLAASVIDQKFNFEVELQAAEVNGDGKVISSPRIVTLDNSTATIEQGVSIPFQTFENGDAQLEFVDAVLKLDVTPHITADGSIIMEIKVSRNAPDDSVFTLTGSPAIAKNQVETETLVKDGQTLVLGGIYVVDRSERQSRVPYLSKLPFLGPLFRSDEFSDSRKELLVFVSPRIVETPADAS